MNVKKRMIMIMVAIAMLAAVCLAGYSRMAQVPVMVSAMEKEEGKKIALTFDGEVILGRIREEGR